MSTPVRKQQQERDAEQEDSGKGRLTFLASVVRAGLPEMVTFKR